MSKYTSSYVSYSIILIHTKRVHVYKGMQSYIWLRRERENFAWHTCLKGGNYVTSATNQHNQPSHPFFPNTSNHRLREYRISGHLPLFPYIIRLPLLLRKPGPRSELRRRRLRSHRIDFVQDSSRSRVKERERVRQRERG